MQRQALLTQLNNLLEPEKYRDYAPNGLQVEGKAEIKQLITGVTACQQLLDEAVARNADAVLVHHGYFWKGEPAAITGMKKRRLQTLLRHDINLLAYHLPLDCHPELGNNAQLAAALGLSVERALDEAGICQVCRPSTPLSAETFAERIEQAIGQLVLFESGGEHAIETVAICSGAGQDYIDQAAEQGVDALLTGEVSERTIHTAREMGIHFFAAGHHATERGGIQALGEYLAANSDVTVTFIDVANPV